MKKIIAFLICILYLTSCSIPDDERKLKEKYDKLIELAQTPEAKQNIENMYKKALEELRENKKEKEEIAKIKYTQENDVTSSLFEFCDELWSDRNYNPAKYEVKCKELKYKSVSFEGSISYIVSEDGTNYLGFFYKDETLNKGELNSLNRSIVFLINTETPEQIMNFKKGDVVSVKGIITRCHKSDSYNEETYFFNIHNPTIEISKNKNSDSSKELTDDEKNQIKIHDLETLSKLNPADAVLIFRTSNDGGLNASTLIPFVIYYNDKFYEVPFKYDMEYSSNFTPLEKKIYKLNNQLAEILVKPLVAPGKKIQLFNNGLNTTEVVISELTENGMSDWKTYSAIVNENIKLKIGSNTSSVSSVPQNKIAPPKLPSNWGEEDARHTRDFINILDINNDGNAEYIYQIGDYEGSHFEIWSFINSEWQLVFEGGYEGV